MKFQVMKQKKVITFPDTRDALKDFPIPSNSNLVYYPHVASKMGLIMTASERNALQLFINDLLSRKCKKFNIQFITSTDDSVKNDKVTLYTLAIDQVSLAELSEGAVQGDGIGALLSVIHRKSNDFADMVKTTGVLHVSKLPYVRRSKTTSVDQSPFFSFIIHGYSKIAK
jgi:hypothetical protein